MKNFLIRCFFRGFIAGLKATGLIWLIVGAVGFGLFGITGFGIATTNLLGKIVGGILLAGAIYLVVPVGKEIKGIFEKMIFDIFKEVIEGV